MTKLVGNSLRRHQRNHIEGSVITIIKDSIVQVYPSPLKKVTIYLQVFVFHIKFLNFYLLSRFFLQQKKIEAHT